MATRTSPNTLRASEKVEERLHQSSVDYSKKMGVLAQQLDELQQEGQQRYEALQIEAARRHETMQQESACQHEQLLKLFATQPQPSSSESAGKSTASNVTLTIREGKQPTGNHQVHDRGNGILLNPCRTQERVEE
uniref:Uncharacterized protein n=1 Tax=Ananas comosus var. bracteatus TaxID=296719 RepID=A0A6V7PA57_ANACO|nr:unnamed protein product [Ananas comosus var. bracteatus]